MTESLLHIYNITILQKYLPLLIRACNMNTEEFGELLGITSQALRNIIFEKSKLTKSMFMAIMTVLDYQRTEGENHATVNTLINALFIPENYVLFKNNIDNYLKMMKSSKKFMRNMSPDTKVEYYLNGTTQKTIPIIYVLCGAKYATIEDLKKSNLLPKELETYLPLELTKEQQEANEIFEKLYLKIKDLNSPLKNNQGTTFWMTNIFSCTNNDSYIEISEGNLEEKLARILNELPLPLLHS